MADEKNRNIPPDEDRPWLHEELKEKSRYDPELEMPDPKQVERDREEMEKQYGNQGEKKDKAA